MYLHYTCFPIPSQFGVEPITSLLFWPPDYCPSSHTHTHTHPRTHTYTAQETSFSISIFFVEWFYFQNQKTASQKKSTFRHTSADSQILKAVFLSNSFFKIWRRATVCFCWRGGRRAACKGWREEEEKKRDWGTTSHLVVSHNQCLSLDNLWPLVITAPCWSRCPCCQNIVLGGDSRMWLAEKNKCELKHCLFDQNVLNFWSLLRTSD